MAAAAPAAAAAAARIRACADMFYMFRTTGAAHRSRALG